MPIDIAALIEARDHHEMLVASYGKAEQKRRQNAALEAAGLPPMHSESSLKWDVEQLAHHQRIAEVLRQVIAYHSGEIFVPTGAAA